MLTILARITLSPIKAMKNTRLERIHILKIISVSPIGTRIPIGESHTRCFIITRRVNRNGIRII